MAAVITFCTSTVEASKAEREQLSRLPDRWRYCLVGENKNAAAFYRARSDSGTLASDSDATATGAPSMFGSVFSGE